MNKKLNSSSTTTQKEVNGLNGSPATKPAEAEIRAAFRFVYDTLEGLMLNSHYTLLGDSARAVRYEDYTPIDKIEVGILTKRMTPEVKQALREWKYEEVDGTWTQTMFNVPIIFRVIRQNYKFLENPDTRFFDVDEYKIPNPFETYWKSRFLVR